MNPNDVQNPFPGLRPFNADEDYLFFGREKQVSELLKLLRHHRFIGVVGTSGSGKSSLVRAGLLPALLGGTMADAGSDWEVVVTRPGGDPITNLAQALLDADLYDADDEESMLRIKATLNRSRLGLIEAARQSDIDEDSNLLIVVDQFEELFRFGQTSEGHQEAAAAFVKLLLAASDQTDESIFVAITMRSDYLGECSQIPGLAEAVNHGEYLIPRLSRHELETAIKGPIQVGGGEISFRLVQHLLNSVGDDPDQLPVLQHVLMRTWQKWQADHSADEPIDVRHYEAVGGMATALSRHADEVYDSLANDEERKAAEAAFKTLTEKGADNRGIRRPTRLDQLAQITGYPLETVRAVVDAYRQPGVTFLMPGTNQAITDHTVIDLSHESLMRVWQSLRVWVEEESQSARIYRRLAETAGLWKNKRAGLYRDPDLQIAQSWREEDRPNAAWAAQYGGQFKEAMSFLDKSQTTVEAAELEREEARKKELVQAKALAETQSKAAANFRRFSAAATVLMLLALGMSIWAFRLQREAEHNRKAAVDNATEAQDAQQLAITEAKKAQAAEKRAIEQAADATALRQETQELLIESQHEQGVAWLERGRSYLEREKDHIGAKLMASRAIGFEGVGRTSTPEFNEQHPVLLKRDSPEWDEVLDFLDSEPEFPLIWSSNSTQHPQSGFNVAYSPDGKQIATRHRDGSVYVWDVDTGNQLSAFTVGDNNTELLWRMQFSPDGKRLYTTTADEVIILDPRQGREIGRVAALAEVVADSLQSLVSTQPDRFRGLAVSQDGRKLAAGGSRGKLYVWDAMTRELGSEFDVGNPIQSIEFHPDNRRVLVGDESGFIHVIDWSRNESIASEQAHDSTIYCIRFSPDGSLVASGSMDDVLRLSNANDLTVQKRFTFNSNVNNATFSPDGSLLACCDNDHLIHIIDLEELSVIRTLEGHSGNVLGIEFSSNDRLASCSNDSSFRFWDVTTGAELSQNANVDEDIQFVALNSTGTSIAAARITTNVLSIRAES